MARKTARKHLFELKFQNPELEFYNEKFYLLLKFLSIIINFYCFKYQCDNLLLLRKWPSLEHNLTLSSEFLSYFKITFDPIVPKPKIQELEPSSSKI